MSENVKLILPESVERERKQKEAEAAASRMAEMPLMQFDEKTINARRPIDTMTVDELRKEASIARNLLCLLSGLFSALETAVRSRPNTPCPDAIAVPVPWLYEAHRVLRGASLPPEPEAKPLTSSSGYGCEFYDRFNNKFLFLTDFTTGMTTLLKEEESKKGLPNTPEAFLWFQSCLLASIKQFFAATGGAGPQVVTLWDAIQLQIEFCKALERGEVNEETLPIALAQSVRQIAKAFEMWEESIQKGSVAL